MKIAAILLIPPLCLAQARLSLKEAVDQAVAQHPALTTASNRVAVAQGFRTQAGLLPNPRLVVQQENVRPYGRPNFTYWRDTDSFSYLQNTFETAGKRQGRITLAETGIHRTQSERDLLRWQITARVASAYWVGAGAEHILTLLSENERNFGRIVEYHEIRVREGSIAEADLLRVRLEAQRLAIDRNRARLEAERSRIQLLREMGRTEFPAITYADRTGDEGASPPDDVAAAIDRRVEVKLARSLLESARANHRLQLSQARPNVDVLFGYKRTGGFDTMMGGVQVDLPFQNRNQGNVAAAAADMRVAESNVSATEALVRAEIEAATVDYRIRRSEIMSSMQPLLEQANETYRIAEAAYREGGADLLRLLDAQRVRNEAQIAHARALVELRLSEVALKAAMGVEP